MGVSIRTGDGLLDGLAPRVERFLEQDRVTYEIDGERVHGYRSPDCPALWLRDHSDILRGARYYDGDLLSGVAHFAATQRGNGSMFDFVSCGMDRENWTKYVRVPVEADVEYRFVKGVYLGWQGTGGDDWLARMLPHAERALAYSCTHSHRWSEEHGLIKRAFTIDTWDFDFVDAEQDWLNFRISERTHWGIFHGDNSGLYEACRLLEKLYAHLGEEADSRRWGMKAEEIGARANELCWNGRFYTHRVPLDGFRMPGVDEEEQLSFSNPMGINRGLADHGMAVAIIDEYRSRRERSGAFAEWFSLDPPFPDGLFGDEKLVGGAYINGGIMPLVGGELARAAFAHGREAYGVEILRQYAALTEESGETYLWYFPDGRPSSQETSTSPEATATDGWGSSAMEFALVEGLAGVVDRDCLFRALELAPRWAAAGIERAEVEVGYGPVEGRVVYRYECAADRCRIELEAPGPVALHLLLPGGMRVKAVEVDGRKTAFAPVRVEESAYVDVELPTAAGIEVVVLFGG